MKYNFIRVFESNICSFFYLLCFHSISFYFCPNFISFLNLLILKWKFETSVTKVSFSLSCFCGKIILSHTGSAKVVKFFKFVQNLHFLDQETETFKQVKSFLVVKFFLRLQWLCLIYGLFYTYFSAFLEIDSYIVFLFWLNLIFYEALQISFKK